MRVVSDHPQAKKYLLSAFAALAAVLVALYFLLIRDRPVPQIEIRGYEVVLFDPNGRSVANVTIENVGGGGTIKVYSSAGFALPTTSAREIKRQLESNTAALIEKDLGGVELTLEAQEHGSFTVNGPRRTPEQTNSLDAGELYFYFSGSILTNGGEPNQGNEVRVIEGGESADGDESAAGDSEKRFCSYVVGNKPDEVLPCPEN
jgi:hypothetical protein